MKSSHRRRPQPHPSRAVRFVPPSPCSRKPPPRDTEGGDEGDCALDVIGVVYDGEWTSVTFTRCGSGNDDSVSVRLEQQSHASPPHLRMPLSCQPLTPVAYPCSSRYLSCVHPFIFCCKTNITLIPSSFSSKHVGAILKGLRYKSCIAAFIVCAKFLFHFFLFSQCCASCVLNRPRTHLARSPQHTGVCQVHPTRCLTSRLATIPARVSSRLENLHPNHVLDAFPQQPIGLTTYFLPPLKACQQTTVVLTKCRKSPVQLHIRY